MTKEKIVKGVKTVSAVAIAIGVPAIVGNAVKFTTPGGLNKLMKVCVGIGTFALGGLAADASSAYAEKKIDQMADSITIDIGKEVEEVEVDVVEQ